MQIFEDRAEAGRRLARALREDARVDLSGRIVVLAIPRGGLPVGAAVAEELGAALDAVVVRKLRSPYNPELGIGAIASDGQIRIDDDMVARLGLSPEQVDAEIADRRAAMEERVELYRRRLRPAALEGAVAIVVDDGVATGGTAKEACAVARRRGAAHVILAVPVAPRATAEALAAFADVVVILHQPAEFLAVGQAYASFDQLDDEAVLAALAGARTA